MRHPIFCLVLLLLFSACRKEGIVTTEKSAKLQFSADTILFDTVFTSTGSTSRRLKVYNRNKNALRISEITLAGGNSSSYQININGQAVNSATRIELAGRDSMTIFVKVLINPGTSNLPFIVADSLHFLTNGNRQLVQLRAYGQNARFLNQKIIEGNITWDKQLPYVIYNSALVSENSKLTIEAGTRIYFHKGSKLFIGGTLQANGALRDSIGFGGDRLEQMYSDEPGQWGGIHFLRSSKDNQLHYVQVKNAIAGIRVDSLSLNPNPKLILSNSIVKNMEVAGLLMYNADVSAFNNLVYNCGQFLVYGALGGHYNFKQNTIAGLNFTFARQTPAVYFADYFMADNILQTAALDLSLVNNIIWGNNDEELVTEKKGSVTFNPSIQNNLLKTKNSNLNIFGNLLNADPLFVDPRKGNYRLTSQSPALNKGLNLGSDPYFPLYLISDLEGKLRIYPSELGCYEFR